jgi:hypothetical protein
LLGTVCPVQVTSCGKHRPVFNTDHHGETGACWPCRAVFAPPRAAGRSKHDGPSAPPSAGAVLLGADLRHGFKKISARNGLEFPMQRESGGWSRPPMGTPMQSSAVQAPCLINKGQFHKTIHESPAERGHSFRHRTSNRTAHRSTCCPGQRSPIMPCSGHGRGTNQCMKRVMSNDPPTPRKAADLKSA